MKNALWVALMLTLATAAIAAPPAPPKPKPLPKPAHIVIVFEENKSPGDITAATAPYITNTLTPMGTSLGKFFAFHHPSQPNYIEFFAGTNQLNVGGTTTPVCNDNCIAKQSTTKNLFSSISHAAGVTFGGYAEDLPANQTSAQILATCAKCKCFQCYFAVKHTPWIDFADVPDSVSHPFTAFPADFTQLPTISIVVPNLINDMHSPKTPKQCQLGNDNIPVEVTQGDTWLKNNLKKYAEWAVKNNSLLIVTWDENSKAPSEPDPCPTRLSPPKNLIPTIIVGQPVRVNFSSPQTYNYYDLLRTILDMYGLAPVGNSNMGKDITDIWQ